MGFANAASPNCTEVTAVGPDITDGNGNLWSFDPAFHALMNGAIFYGSGPNLTDMFYSSGSIWVLYPPTGEWYASIPAGTGWIAAGTTGPPCVSSLCSATCTGSVPTGSCVSNCACSGATSTPTPSATPTPTALTSTLTFTSTSNGRTFNNYQISTTSGPCVVIDGVTNLTLQDFQIGPCGTNNSTADSNGIEINASSDINIYDSYIHVQNLSSRWADDHDGILISGSLNINGQGNVLAFNETSVEVTNGASSNVTFNGTSANPTGPFPRVIKYFQIWGPTSGAGNTNISGADNNRTLPSCQTASNDLCPCRRRGMFALYWDGSEWCDPTLAGSGFPFTLLAKQEDALNFGYTNGYTVTGNWVEGEIA